MSDLADQTEREHKMYGRAYVSVEASGYPQFMGASQLSPEEIHAAAGAHRELGPEYHDAVVASFLAKVEKEIDARVEARLADSPRARRRQLDRVTLTRRRLALKYMALGLRDRE